MTATANRDLAKEIGCLIRDGETDAALAIVDVLLASRDFAELDRIRTFDFRKFTGDEIARTLLARRLDTAPLADFGMASIFAIQVYGKPVELSSEAVEEHLRASWGPGLKSLAVDKFYRGFDGLPSSPISRMSNARFCAEHGPEAALAFLPRRRGRDRRPWYPQFIVCAATSSDFRDDFSRGPALVTGRMTKAESDRWVGEAHASWAGRDTYIRRPKLLGAAVEIARMETVRMEIDEMARRAKGGLLDVERGNDGSLTIWCKTGTRNVVGAGFLEDEDILELTEGRGAHAHIRRPLSKAACH